MKVAISPTPTTSTPGDLSFVDLTEAGRRWSIGR